MPDITKGRKNFKVAYPDPGNRLGHMIDEWQKSQPSDTRFSQPVAKANGWIPLATTIVTIDFERPAQQQ